jgi:hypothetical protein
MGAAVKLLDDDIEEKEVKNPIVLTSSPVEVKLSMK